MAGTPKRLAGPAYLAGAAANVYNPASGTYALIRHIHIVNTDASSRTFSLFVGLTGGSAGGTEIYKTFTLTAAGTSGSYIDYYGQPLRLDPADFLTGFADVANKVVVTVEGELFVS